MGFSYHLSFMDLCRTINLILVMLYVYQTCSLLDAHHYKEFSPVPSLCLKCLLDDLSDIFHISNTECPLHLHIKCRKKLTCKRKEGKMEGFHKEWACYSAKAGKTVWMLFFLDVNFVFLLVLFLCTGWLQYDTWQASRVRFMYCSRKHAIEQLF